MPLAFTALLQQLVSRARWNQFSPFRGLFVATQQQDDGPEPLHLGFILICTKLYTLHTKQARFKEIKILK